LSDEVLVAKTVEVAGASRRALANLLPYLGEFGERQLYRQEACSSMFAYCTQRLGMSEDEAFARIRVARLCKRFPRALRLLAEGKVHLTGLRLLAPHLCEENVEEILGRAAGLSRRKIEELVCELAPKADAPAVVRKLPQPRNVTSDKKIPVQGSGQVTQPAPTAQPAPARTMAGPAALVQPLAPARYKVQFTTDQVTRDKLKKAQELAGRGVSLETLMTRAIDLFTADLEKKRLGVADRKPRPAKTTSRYIAKPTRRLVFERDGGQCTFQDSATDRCTERHGRSAHNQLAAEKYFGAESMAAKRARR
jgi:hypothetical protein